MGIKDKGIELIEKIKKIFSGKKQKLLTDGTKKSYANEKKNFLDSMKVKEENIFNESKNEKVEYERGSLEDAIDQFLMGMSYENQDKRFMSSYQVLTNLFSFSDQNGKNNLENETKIIQALKNQPG